MATWGISTCEHSYDYCNICQVTKIFWRSRTPRTKNGIWRDFTSTLCQIGPDKGLRGCINFALVKLIWRKNSHLVPDSKLIKYKFSDTGYVWLSHIHCRDFLVQHLLTFHCYKKTPSHLRLPPSVKLTWWQFCRDWLCWGVVNKTVLLRPSTMKFHHNDVTWALRRLLSPVTRLSWSIFC